MWLGTWTSPLFWVSVTPLSHLDDKRGHSHYLIEASPHGGAGCQQECVHLPWRTQMAVSALAVPLTRPYIPIWPCLFPICALMASSEKRKIAAMWGWEGDKKQTVVKRLCRGLGPALVRGNGEEAQVEAQENQAAKAWASLCSTPGACMQTSLFSTS